MRRLQEQPAKSTPIDNGCLLRMRGGVTTQPVNQKQNGGICRVVYECTSDAEMADQGANATEGEGGGGESKAIEKDPVLAEINKKIEEAFDIFDHEGSKTVDVR